MIVRRNASNVASFDILFLAILSKTTTANADRCCDQRHWFYGKTYLVQHIDLSVVVLVSLLVCSPECKLNYRYLNSDKICRSYSDLNFGVTFLEHSVVQILFVS